jgi:hypothetical protein
MGDLQMTLIDFTPASRAPGPSGAARGGRAAALHWDAAPLRRIRFGTAVALLGLWGLGLVWLVAAAATAVLS